jgi:hypothetical protein
MTDLFNLVVAATQNPRRGFGEPSFRIKQSKKLIEKEARKTRMDLLGSQKFYVCDSLMHHACEATTQNPKTMLNMMNAAIPPFDNMWIEWDEDERADNMLSGAVSSFWESIEHPMQLASDAHSGEWGDRRTRYTEPRRPKKVGFHIYACKYTVGAYYADIYFLFPTFDRVGRQGKEADLMSGKIGCSPYSLRFTVGDNFGWSELYGYFSNAEIFKPVALGGLGAKKLGVAESVDECVQIQLEEGPNLFGLDIDHKSRELDSLYLKAGLISSSAIGRICLLNEMQTVSEKHPHRDREEVVNAVYGRARENGLTGWRGEIRWIVAVLSLLNYSHTVIERDQEPSEAKRRVFGVPVPRNEVRVVQIDLPKPRGTVQYEKLFTGSGAKKRRHVRRGHYRRYIHKDGTVTERWIAEQWVGDASLGTIIHDYELINKRNKKT